MTKKENSYKRILVTGAAGFIGCHLVDHLIDRGFNVFGVDDLSGGFLRNVNKRSKFTKLDLRDKKKVDVYIKKVKPDLIYHLAADATEGRSQFTPIECTERNYFAYLNLLIPAVKNGLKKIVVTSSMAVYGNQKAPFSEDMLPRPEDIYGISKAAMEAATEVLASVHGFEYVIVRPHNVYGPRQNMADPYRNVVAIFINRLLLGKPFYIYGDGEQKRSFTYIDDCVIPLARTGLYKGLNSEIFNIGAGPKEAATINELANVVTEEFFGGAVPKNLQPKYLPMRPQEVRFAYSSHDKTEKLLGYRLKTGLREGVKETVVWARSMGYQKPIYLNQIELPSSNLPETWKKKLI
ncbi:NAD-dependent epimerase/dehydratase family protein [Candidatus Falkowbacteria bacterium]|nr:NAD-dependent epimerase/dehydratase family protein [Candidatus Falkowbacteria bacterium]